MNKHYSKKARWAGAIIIILVAIIAIYSNRSYAYIYNHIDKMALTASNKSRVYMVYNNKKASSSLVYVALGDSLTAGVGANKYSESYPYLLAQYFAGNDYRVILKSRAVPGAKTQDLLSGLLPGTIKDNPDIVTLLIGVNDIHGQININDFQKNYELILQRLTEETKAKIYVINIPLIGSNNLLLPPYNYIFDARTKEYNKVIKELTVKYQVKYVDLYLPSEALFKSSGSHYASDFFHPSAQGYKIWADLIYADISQ